MPRNVNVTPYAKVDCGESNLSTSTRCRLNANTTLVSGDNKATKKTCAKHAKLLVATGRWRVVS